MLLSWTQSSGQTGDTIMCYGLHDLKRIATIAVELKSCTTGLNAASQMSINRGHMIDAKNVEITNLNNQISLKDKLIGVKEDEIKTLKICLEKSKLSLVRNKRATVISIVAAGAFILYVQSRH